MSKVPSISSLNSTVTVVSSATASVGVTATTSNGTSGSTLTPALIASTAALIAAAAALSLAIPYVALSAYESQMLFSVATSFATAAYFSAIEISFVYMSNSLMCQ